LKQITGYAGEARYGSAKAGDILRIYLDASKAKRELGWEPTVSLNRGLMETVEFVRQARAK
ncbi:MAG: UDP-glucose 4-epimerase, partial [Chloroflexi bacterium]|nr:UDP-glucose 4-epimerase [Chloroflexota bacterium]